MWGRQGGQPITDECYVPALINNVSALKEHRVVAVSCGSTSYPTIILTDQGTFLFFLNQHLFALLFTSYSINPDRD